MWPTPLTQVRWDLGPVCPLSTEKSPTCSVAPGRVPCPPSSGLWSEAWMRGRKSIYIHITEDKTEAQRGKGPCQGHSVRTGYCKNITICKLQLEPHGVSFSGPRTLWAGAGMLEPMEVQGLLRWWWSRAPSPGLLPGPGCSRSRGCGCQDQDHHPWSLLPPPSSERAVAHQGPGAAQGRGGAWLSGKEGMEQTVPRSPEQQQYQARGAAVTLGFQAGASGRALPLPSLQAAPGATTEQGREGQCQGLAPARGQQPGSHSNLY